MTDPRVDAGREPPMTEEEVREMVERHDGDPRGIAEEYVANLRSWLDRTVRADTEG